MDNLIKNDCLILTEPFCLIEAEGGACVIGIDVDGTKVPVEVLPNWPNALRRMRYDHEALSFDQWCSARAWVAGLLLLEAEDYIAGDKEGLN